MRNRKPHEAHGLRTYAVVLDKGDETVEQLARFAREQGISGGRDYGGRGVPGGNPRLFRSRAADLPVHPRRRA
jgi:hypothetical protein